MATVVKVNASLKDKLSNFVDDETRLFAQNTLYRYMAPYTPMRTGLLRDNVEITKDGIRYLSPYARYLYNGQLMVSAVTGSAWAKHDEPPKVLADPPKELRYSHDVSPLATSHWGQAAMDAKSDMIIGEIEDYIIKRKMGKG